MAEIVVPGPVSGRRYGFVISGETPTVDEQMRIDAAIRQQEDQYAGEFEAQYGDRPAGTEAGVLDYLGEFPKGLGRGAVGIGESAALGIASLLPEEYETPTREAIRRGAYSLKPQVDIGLEETVSGKFGEATGSFLPLLGASALPGGMGIAGGLAVGAGAGEASERARAAGATVEERAQALPFGAAVGALELVPIKFMKALGRDGTLSVAQRIARIAESAGVEGAQEAAAEVAQNLISQNIYNPEQGTFTGTGESLGYGAGVGALVQGLMDLAIPGRSRAPSQAETDETRLLPPPSQEEIDAASPQQETQDVEPSGLPDPAGDITTATLDQLGVPKAAPSYKRIPTIADREDQLRMLSDFANATKDPRAEANVRTFIEQARAADLSSVSPELSDFGDIGARDGVRGDVGPERGDTGGVAAPDGAGLDVPRGRTGPPAGTVGTQPTALTESEAFELAAQQAEAARPVAPEVAEPVVPPAPEAPEPVVPTTPEVAEPPAQAELALEPASEQGFVPGFDVEPEGADVRGVDPFAEEQVQRQEDITPEEIESRVATEPLPEETLEPAFDPETAVDAEPELLPAAGAEPAPLVEVEGLTTAERDRNAIPGQATGAAGQVIPEGIAPAPGREPELRPSMEGEGEINRAVNAARARKAQRDRTADTNAATGIRRKFAENSPALQTFTREEVVPDPDQDVTSAEDKQVVLALLNKTFTKREKKSTNPEWAAHEYFRKHPDAMTALDTIAYDAVAAPTKFAKITEDMSDGAKEYYRNTGRAWGTSAGKWVLDNLSQDARLAVFERIDFYRPAANDAVQRAAAQDRDNAVKRDRAYREYMGDQTGDYVGVTPDTATAEELGFGVEDLKDVEALFSKTAAVDMPMHPQVVRAIQRGDVNGAIDGIIATSGSLDAGKLAAKLRPFVQNVTLRVFEPQQMADLNEVFGDGVRDEALGVYVFRYNEAELAAAEQYAPERVALRRELGGSVIINSQTGFTPSTFLHELIHVATMSTLNNESHPLTRQVETLLETARKTIPKGENGILNRYEFVSEAMTNPAFISELSKIDVGLGKDKFTMRQRIMHSLANFVRQVFGRPQKTLGTVKSDLDQFFDDLLAPEPMARGVGSLYEAAFRPNGYRDTMNSMKGRVKEFTPKNGEDIRRLARTTLRRIPYSAETKDFVIRASAPLMFVAETAQRYMPSAYQVYETVMSHGAAQHRMSTRVDETMMEIQSWAKKNRDKIDLFNRVRFMATEFRVDPRKDRSAYDQFELSYDIIDADGDVTGTKTERFRTREARASRYNTLRDNPTPTRSNPRNSYDPESDANVERLEAHKELKNLYRQLGSDGQKALARAFDMPEYFRGEMQRVVKLRLDSMFEGQRTMQERVYKNVFNKIFAETLIDPYQALQRRGTYGLSYVARDPDTGDIKVFKHAFENTQDRDAAIGRLSRLGPEAEIDQITPYDMSKPAQMQERPSLGFVTAVLNQIGASGQLASRQLETEFLDLVFEATPETSFFRAYQKRANVPGYEGDITPADEGLTIGDTMDNIRRNGMHLAAKVADTEYQVKLDKLRNALDAERIQFEQNTNAREPDLTKRAANAEEARSYQSILNDFTRAPFRERANWSRSLTAGGYALTLGFNVSTVAMTFFQMPTIIYPYLAGKYGPRNSMQSLGIATRLLTSSGRERTIERVGEGGALEQVRRKVGWYDFSVSNLDFTDPRNAYLQQLNEVADSAGVFNRSLTQDILDETGAKGWVQKTAAYSGLMQHHSERLMRESTLLSTYLMELQKNIPQGQNMSLKAFTKALRSGQITVPEEVGRQAARESVYTSDMTNGSILAAAAPITSQSDVGSVIYLFKRFPLAMLNMLWHTMKRAGSSTNDPVDRRVAAMQFAGMSGSIAMLAGASGIPMFHAVAAIYNLAKDEEDEDFETMIRTGVLGEVGLTGLVDYYAGISVSSRIGLSGVFYRPGFNTENQTALTTLLEGFGGPVVGLFTKYTDRVPYFFNEGEYWRMTEAAMPTAMGNAMKSIRFYSEGARTLRHDPILDEVGPLAAGAQFFGFMPTEYARQLAQNNYIRGVDNRINRDRTKLLSRRYKAYRLGDRIEMREIMRDIAEFNAEFNAKYPQAAIDRDTLKRSLQSHQDTTSRMHHGITYSRKNEEYLRRLAEDYGNATAFSR